MVVGTCGLIMMMVMIMAVPMVVAMGMIMVVPMGMPLGIIVGMPMSVIVKAVVVGHGASLARVPRKIAL